MWEISQCCHLTLLETHSTPRRKTTRVLEDVRHLGRVEVTVWLSKGGQDSVFCLRPDNAPAPQSSVRSVLSCVWDLRLYVKSAHRAVAVQVVLFPVFGRQNGKHLVKLMP